MIEIACMSSPDGKLAERGKKFAPMVAWTIKTPLITHIVLLCGRSGNEEKTGIIFGFGVIRNMGAQKARAVARTFCASVDGCLFDVL
jgi:hypothetical protein